MSAAKTPSKVLLVVFNVFATTKFEAFWVDNSSSFSSAFKEGLAIDGTIQRWEIR
jgi:hypothetical protein